MDGFVIKVTRTGEEYYLRKAYRGARGYKIVCVNDKSDANFFEYRHKAAQNIRRLKQNLDAGYSFEIEPMDQIVESGVK